MNIAILGCGYVGSAIAQRLRQSQHFITATTTTPERIPELEAIAQQVVILKGDTVEGLRSLLDNQDAVIVTVAPGGDQQVDAEGYRETYLHTAKNLVAALSQTDRVKQVIYTSSCAVYGDRHGAWVNESSPVDPVNLNGEILDQTEQTLLSATTETLILCVLRLGAIYGPEREIAARFSKLAGTTRPGSGDHFTNWVHLDDIAASAEFALTHQLQGFFNVVQDVPLTMHDLFDQLCDRYKLPPVEWDASLPRPRSNNRQVSNQKLKAIGYQFIHPHIEI
jgi:nucleoside-diphosphate-sugar epimerase